MEVELKLFANFGDILGRRKISVTADTIRDLLENIRDEHEELSNELFEDEKNLELKDFVIVTVNGQRIEVLDGLDTQLKDNDSVAVFPPVAGG